MNLLAGILARLLCAGLLVAGALSPEPATAQPIDQAAAVRNAEAEVEGLKRDLNAVRTAEDRTRLLEEARAIHERAVALQETLAAPVAQIEQRIEQLGPDAADNADTAIRQQHRALSQELAAQVALTRRTALVEVEALQRLNALAEEQARVLGEELFQRATSPLAPALWIDGYAALEQDIARAHAGAVARVEPTRPLPMIGLALVVWVGVVLAAAGPGQRLVDRWGARLADRLAGQETPFTLPLFAVWSVLADVALVVACALALLLAMNWAALPTLLLDIGGVLVVAGVIGFFSRATVVAILQPRLPEWRLWKTSDEAANCGVKAGNATAIAIALIIAVEASVERLAVSLPSRVFLHSALALVTVVQIAYALHMLGRMQQAQARAENEGQPSGRSGAELWIGLGGLGVLFLTLAGMFGYVSLANRLSQWAIWAVMVLLTTYILMALVDGLCRRLATARARDRRTPSSSRALQQASVVLSAVLRLLLLLVACGAVLVPFGAGFTSVFGLLTPVFDGFEVGGVRISAGAVLRAALAFVVVIALIRFVRIWITDSYLPTTNLQADARDSIDKILRYIGIVLAVLWAMTAFGVGMEKVAILASALSVGIGFGLQAITQNFVSGLILLIERPVRIGDWVKLNDVEGDIRRINVRSTEIRVGDHSTMIVPNSELITKVVQNKTKGNSLGRAQIQFSVPVDSDLDEAIDTIMKTMAADADVLETPAPAVFLDRVEGSMAVLNCFLHLRSPRIAYGVRSRVTLAVLRALRGGGHPASLPSQPSRPAPSSPDASAET